GLHRQGAARHAAELMAAGDCAGRVRGIGVQEQWQPGARLEDGL
ncbi:hypothetical protein, partial [Pseudomonas fluorescens]